VLAYGAVCGDSVKLTRYHRIWWAFQAMTRDDWFVVIACLLPFGAVLATVFVWVLRELGQL